LAIWYIFSDLVRCTEKNLATLSATAGLSGWSGLRLSDLARVHRRRRRLQVGHLVPVRRLKRRAWVRIPRGFNFLGKILQCHGGKWPI
jgi:hypothetical protein